MKQTKDKVLYIAIAVGAVLLLLAAAMPLLYVSKYSHPCADDYTYGVMTHMTWQNTHSVVETVKQAFSQVKSSYYTWQGTHTSIFFMALSPAVFEGNVGYGLTAFLMVTMLIVSVFFCVITVLSKVMKADRAKSVFVAAITAFWMMESIYSPVNGFFWFNGAVHYSFMHGCMLIMASCLIGFLCEKTEKDRQTVKIAFLVGASLFGFLCGGANYSTALLTGCLIGLTVVYVVWQKKGFAVCIPVAVYGASFLISILAPGNSVRGGHFEGKGPVQAVVEALKLAWYDDWHWIDLQTLLILLILLPILYAIAGECAKISKWWITVVSIVLSFGLHAAMNVPLFFAMGGGGVARQENICKFWYQLMIVWNLLLILCVVRKYLEKYTVKLTVKVQQSLARGLVATAVYFGILFVFMAVHMKLSDKSIFQYSSYIAYVEIRNGEAADYYGTYQTRLERVEADKGDVIVPEYSSKPYLLYFDDITEDMYNWENTAFARWYGLNSVRK